MAVDTYALISVEYAKAYAGWTDDDLQVPGITIYHNESASATAATVEVTATAIVLIITGGGNAATYTYTLSDAANDTLGEVVGVINTAAKGFVAVAVGRDSAASGDLVPADAVSCFGVENKQTLYHTDDTTIEYLIDAASDRIERYLNRKIKTRAYVEYYDGTSDPELVLRQAPVTALTRVAIGRLDAIQVKTTVTDASHAMVRVTPTADPTTTAAEDESAATVVLTIVGGASAGTDTLTLSGAANDTLVELTAVIVALDGWTATLLHTTGEAGSRSSADLIPMEGRYVDSTRGVDLEVPDVAEDDFQLDARLGRLMRRSGWQDYWPAGHRNIRVDYTAGWTTVPDDIQQACAEIVKVVYQAAKRDSGLASENIGNYAYQVMGAGMTGTIASRPLPALAKDLLAPFRRGLV